MGVSPSSSKLLCLLVTALALAFVSSTGFAQNRAGADVMFEAARKAMADGDYDLACQKFEESNRLERAAGTILNLGNCEEQRGRIATAWLRYAEAMELLSKDDKRFAFAKKKAGDLEGRIPRLTLKRAEGAPREMTFMRNGRKWDPPIGAPLRLDPETHVIEVRAPNYKPKTYEIALFEEDDEVLVVAPGEPIEQQVARPAQVDDPQADSEAGGRRRVGLLIGGAGAAAALAGITFGILTYNEYLTVDEECDYEARECASQDGADAAELGGTYELLAYGLGVVGAAGLGVGTYFLLSSGKAGKKSDAEKGAEKKPTSSTVLQVGHMGRGAGLRLRHTF